MIHKIHTNIIMNIIVINIVSHDTPSVSLSICSIKVFIWMARLLTVSAYKQTTSVIDIGRVPRHQRRDRDTVTRGDYDLILV